LSTDGRPEITATFQRSKPRWAATVSAEACVSMDTHAMAAPRACAASIHLMSPSLMTVVFCMKREVVSPMRRSTTCSGVAAVYFIASRKAGM